MCWSRIYTCTRLCESRIIQPHVRSGPDGYISTQINNIWCPVWDIVTSYDKEPGLHNLSSVVRFSCPFCSHSVIIVPHQLLLLGLLTTYIYTYITHQHVHVATTASPLECVTRLMSTKPDVTRERWNTVIHCHSLWLSTVMTGLHYYSQFTNYPPDPSSDPRSTTTQRPICSEVRLNSVGHCLSKWYC